jgi:uncharacterized Zn finger protein (UPF0148 family)
MNYCPDCGEPLEKFSGASFCPGCGSPLNDSEVSTDTPPAERSYLNKDFDELTEGEKEEVLQRVADFSDDEIVSGICELAAQSKYRCRENQ